MNKIKIENRILDSKSHELRNQKIIPGVIYGPTINTEPIKATLREIKKATEQPGEIYQVNHCDKSLFVKFENIQKDPVSHELLHFSLVQIPQGAEGKVEIPIQLNGTPFGVKKGGVLLTIKDSVTVNGKPRSIPKKIEADISNLKIGDKLTVHDLNIPKKVYAVDHRTDIIAVCRPPSD